MSESILKALMQLFAIIARPVPNDTTSAESDYSERRRVVEEFLKNQLNQELVAEYLKVFDYFYRMYKVKQSDRTKTKKRTSSNSVRVLKICTQINDELLQQQKIVVLVRLLEFVRPDAGCEVTPQEMAFIQTVSETFNVPEAEFELLRNFVLTPFDEVAPSPNILIIDDKPEGPEGFKHLQADNVSEAIKVATVESSGMMLMRHCSDHELYLNGHLLQKNKVFVLTNGSSIRSANVKPIYYSDIVGRFRLDKYTEKIEFRVDEIEYRFMSGKLGLQRMSFTEESGHLVGIMGASGAGKTTLLNVLNGNEMPSAGHVLINGFDIHRQKEKITGQIGFVSQDDLLIEELTVYQNLYYNARLCFDNYTNEQIEAEVNRTLSDLGLYEIRDMVVGSPLNKKISGGQRKRLNIALELIREPAILFLDEPTSGLSSRDSENILDLLKELTLKGKLVFVVIHQPSSDIFKMFDRLVILDTGGYLIYNGDPIESIVYFKSRVQHADWNESECARCGNVNPEQIFNIVETRVLDEYGNPTRTRKVSPQEWHQHYQNLLANEAQPKEAAKALPLPQMHFKTPGWLKQLGIFIKRDVLSKLANRQYLIINALETPLMTFLLAYIIKFYNVDVSNSLGYTLFGNSNIPVYLFMAVIIAVFVGLTVSAEEIIKDRKIQKRETFLNLNWGSYIMSKITILLAISAIQALLFVLIGNTILEIHGMYFKFWLVLFSVWFSSNMLGLVISDSFKTVVTIYILIPFLVIPQIILSGIIVKYEKLNPHVSSPSAIPLYGEVIVARWAYEAMAVEMFSENRYQQPLYPYDEAMSVSDYRRNYWIRSMQNKLDFCSRNLQLPEQSEAVADAITLLHNEFVAEYEHPQGSGLNFAQLETITPETLTPEGIEAARQHLELLRRYYVKLYNKASTEKDQYVSEQQSTPELREAYIALKQRYSNESLTEFVRNTNEIERIIEYDGQLIQKIDPIYLYPTGQFLRAHFYSPVKPFFGQYASTYWVNVAVIWAFSLIFYLMLRFRWLKRALDWIEEHSNRADE